MGWVGIRWGGAATNTPSRRDATRRDGRKPKRSTDEKNYDRRKGRAVASASLTEWRIEPEPNVRLSRSFSRTISTRSEKLIFGEMPIRKIAWRLERLVRTLDATLPFSNALTRLHAAPP